MEQAIRSFPELDATYSSHGWVQPQPSSLLSTLWSLHWAPALPPCQALDNPIYKAAEGRGKEISHIPLHSEPSSDISSFQGKPRSLRGSMAATATESTPGASGPHHGLAPFPGSSLLVLPGAHLELLHTPVPLFAKPVLRRGGVFSSYQLSSNACPVPHVQSQGLPPTPASSRPMPPPTLHDLVIYWISH